MNVARFLIFQIDTVCFCAFMCSQCVHVVTTMEHGDRSVTLLLQAEEMQRNITIGSSVPSSKHPSALPAVASVDERRPAEERQSPLQHPQAGLQALYMQAQPQVHSQVYVLLSPIDFVLYAQVRTWLSVSPDLCQHD